MNYKRTKIVATIGPSTTSKTMIEKMIIAGVDTIRINMSHYTKEINIETLVKNIRSISKKLNKSVAIMMDLPGPKIRTSNKEVIRVRKGGVYTLGNNADIPLNIDFKFKGIEKGAKVKIDDG